MKVKKQLTRQILVRKTVWEEELLPQQHKTTVCSVKWDVRRCQREGWRGDRAMLNLETKNLDSILKVMGGS